MSKLYELREGDDVRTIQIELISNHGAPASASLILVRGAVRIERDLTVDTSGEFWVYRFTDDDFEELEPGTWKGWVYATFSDGTNGSFPTRDHIQVRVYAQP